MAHPQISIEIRFLGIAQDTAVYSEDIPVVSVPVDTSTTADQLKTLLRASDQWPVILSDHEVLPAISECVRNVIGDSFPPPDSGMAHFAVTVPEPDNYEILLVQGYELPFWTWRTLPDGNGDTVSGGGYDTVSEARVAAWRDSFAH